MFQNKKCQKVLHKAEYLISMLENRKIQTIMNDIIKNELLNLQTFCQTHKDKQLTQNTLNFLVDDPVQKQQSFIDAIKRKLEYSYEDILQIKIKKLLALLFIEGIAFPQILLHLKNICEINYSCELEQELLNKLPDNQQYSIESNTVSLISNKSEEELIFLTLKYIDEKSNNNNYEDIEQLSFNTQDQKIYNLIISFPKNIQDFGIQSIQLITNIQQKQQLLQLYNNNPQQKKLEQTLLGLIFLLNHKRIPFVGIIKHLQYQNKQSLKQENKNEGIIKFIDSNKLLKQILSEQYDCLHYLNIDPSLSGIEIKKQNKQPDVIQFIYQHFKNFKKKSFYDIVNENLNLIYLNCDSLSQNLNEVFQEQNVINFLNIINKYWKEELLQLKTKIKQLSIEDQNQQLINNDILMIGFKVIKIQSKLKYHIQSTQIVPKTEVKISIQVNEKSDLLYSKINPFYQKFIKWMKEEEQKPFPYFLLTLKLGQTNVYVKYTMAIVKEITLSLSFQAFILQKYGIHLSNDAQSNVQMLFDIKQDQQETRYKHVWPSLIRQTIEFIVQEKEYIVHELIPIVNNQQFQEMIQELEDLYEKNTPKMYYKYYFNQLNQFIKQQQQ